MGFICMIRCWDCGAVIEDYDPALDQYSCAKCREKAAKAYEKRNRMRKPRHQTITEDTDLAEFDF